MITVPGEDTGAFSWDLGSGRLENEWQLQNRRDRVVEINTWYVVYILCHVATADSSARCYLFPHRLTSSFSLAQPTPPFVWLDAAQDSTTGSSGISEWFSLTWIVSLLAVAHGGSTRTCWLLGNWRNFTKWWWCWYRHCFSQNLQNYDKKCSNEHRRKYNP